MSQTLTYTGTLTITRCHCGIELAIPRALYDAMQADSSYKAYCPLGHTFVYSRNRATLASERAEAAEAQAIALRDQLAATERSRAALKGQVTRVKRRIGKGVCPCCNRSFGNVAAHMSTKHPEYAESA